jgi:hypothetical protein
VLLLVLAGLRVLVAEDEVDLESQLRSMQEVEMVYLVGGTALIRSEHDDVGRGVGEFLGVKGRVVLEELQVRTTAIKTICVHVRTPTHPNSLRAKKLTLKLDFVLNNESLVLVVNGLGELGGDGMVSGLVLDNQSLVTFHAFEHRRLLNGPSTNVCPLLLIVDLLLRA